MLADKIRLDRRDFLKLLGLASASVLVPSPLRREPRAASAAGAAIPPGFLTPEEFRILEAATETVIPSDELPGAKEAGVAHYIQSFLTYGPGANANCDRRVGAADVLEVQRRLAGTEARCAEAGDVDGDGDLDASDAEASLRAVFRARPIFAGGPFSGRWPQPHRPVGSRACAVCHLAPSQEGTGAGKGTLDFFPPNFFHEHVPLNRLQLLGWKLRLLGASAVPEVAGNPLATESFGTGLRERYRAGLAALDAQARERFGAPFVELSIADRERVLSFVSPTFVDTLTRHTIEGLLCAPEYGGNQDQVGWKLVGFDGDSQPLGYEIYDFATGTYRERPDKPNSTPNPDDPCAPFSEPMNRFLSLIVATPPVQPAARFSSPYCFGIDEEPA